MADIARFTGFKRSWNEFAFSNIGKKLMVNILGTYIEMMSDDEQDEKDHNRELRLAKRFKQLINENPNWSTKDIGTNEKPGEEAITTL